MAKYRTEVTVIMVAKEGEQQERVMELIEVLTGKDENPDPIITYTKIVTETFNG